MDHDTTPAHPAVAALGGLFAGLYELAQGGALAWSEATALRTLQAVVVGSLAALALNLLARRWPSLFGRQSPISHNPSPPPAAPKGNP